MKKVLSVLTLAGLGLVHGAASSNTTGAATGSSALPPTIAIQRVQNRRAVAGLDNTCDPNGVCLNVTVSTDVDPTSCGVETSLSAAVGDQVNFCYTITNNSNTAFNYQTLSDNRSEPDQEFFVALPYALLPGATYQYNRIETLGASLRSTATWTATATTPTYSFDDSAPIDFIDITADGTDLDLSYYGQRPVALPFPVNFYGVPASHLVVGNNGVIGFGAGYQNLLGLADFSLPTALLAGNGVAPMILPYALDLSGAYGAIYAKELGSAPNRKFIVEWYDRTFTRTGVGAAYPPNPGGVTFEVVFAEGSDEILFQYLNTAFDDPNFPDADNGGTAAVGLNFGVLSDGLTGIASTYSSHTPSLHDGLALRWTPSAVAVSHASAWTGVTIGTPAIALDRTSFNETVPFGGSATDAFVLSNVGTADVRFSVGAPSPGAHVPTGQRYARPAPDAQPFMSPPQLARERLAAYQRAMAQPSDSPWRQAFPPATAASAFTGRQPLGSQDVPAYAAFLSMDVNTGLGDTHLATLDVLAPGTLSPFGATAIPDPLIPIGFDFVDDDFTTLYGIVATDLVKYNTTTGTATLVGPTGLGARVLGAFGARYYAAERKFYVVGCSEDLFGGCALYTVDLGTGATTQVAYLRGPDAVSSRPVAIAINQEGEMYGASSIGQLLAIDRTTGDINIVGEMNISSGNSSSYFYMDFDDRDDALYMISFDPNLVAATYAVDTTTGLARALGTLPFGVIDSSYVFPAILAIATASPFGPCTDLTETPWLAVDRTSGTIPVGAGGPVSISFDASSLADGIYTANLCVNSNDPARRHVILPVTLTVGTGDRIFVNGFDGASP